MLHIVLSPTVLRFASSLTVAVKACLRRISMVPSLKVKEKVSGVFSHGEMLFSLTFTIIAFQEEKSALARLLSPSLPRHSRAPGCECYRSDWALNIFLHPLVDRGSN